MAACVHTSAGVDNDPVARLKDDITILSQPLVEIEGHSL
jgi:hypothetical protein